MAQLMRVRSRTSKPLKTIGNDASGGMEKRSGKPRESLKGESSSPSAVKGQPPWTSQFKATKKWNYIMGRFRKEMPVKRHRRIFEWRYYEDCFTGKEAVDFLYNKWPHFPKEIVSGPRATRMSCALLLGKFLKTGLFASVRTNNTQKEGPFRDTEIYRFTDIPLEKLSSTPKLVRRAASFNELSGEGDDLKETGISNSQYKTHKFEWVPARIAFANMRPNSPLARSRRLSSSHGNLPSMLSPRFDSSETVGSTHVEIDFNVREEDEDVDEDAAVSEPPNDFPSGDCQILEEEEEPMPSPIDKVISELLRVSSEDRAMAEHDPEACRLRHIGTVAHSVPSQGTIRCSLQSGKSDNTQRVRGQSGSFSSQTSLAKISGRRRSNESDVFALWKDAVRSLLQKILGAEHLDGIFDVEFYGGDVKWNCESVGRKGIVRVRDGDDDLPHVLIEMMRYLSRWPFEQKLVNAHVVYPGMEVNVFENVCEHFVNKDAPLLPALFAKAILNVVAIIQQRNPSSIDVEELQLESELAEPSAPIGDFVSVSRQRFERPATSIPVPFLREGLTGLRVRPSMAHSDGGSPRACAISPLTSRSTVSEDSDFLLGRYDGVLSHLDHSPELFNRLDELARASDPKSVGFHSLHRAHTVSSSSLKTPRLGLSPLVAHIAEKDELDLVTSVALILLCLPPPVRRRLHCLLRFMQRICKNHCLILDRNRENRYVVLERLSEGVTTASETVSAVQGLHLVAFLVDNENELFTVPEDFVKIIRRVCTPPRIEKKLSDIRVDSSSSVVRPTKQYCEPVDEEEYEKQKERCAEEHLLALLDDIHSNENLSVDERRKQLKKFKKTYPEIYAKRSAPKADVKNPGILSRLRTIRFK